MLTTRYIVRILAAVLALVAAPLASATGGAALFVHCVACHGKDGHGNDTLGAPAIAGQERWYIERQLDNFTAGRRGSNGTDAFGKQMAGAVTVLKSPAERLAVSAYVAGLPKVGAGGTAIKSITQGGKADLSNGRTHFNALCSSCHGAAGQGNTSLSAPRLAGQRMAYLTRQFSNFKLGIRGTHAEDKAGKQMAAISKLLPDAKTEADVMAYIATLVP